MVAQLKITADSCVIYGTKTQFGGTIPDVSVEVRLFKITGFRTVLIDGISTALPNLELFQRTAVNKFGYFEFVLPKNKFYAGTYLVRYMGTGSAEDRYGRKIDDEYIEVFGNEIFGDTFITTLINDNDFISNITNTFINNGLTVPVAVCQGLPDDITVSVEEVLHEKENRTDSSARITLSNVVVLSGEITQVQIKHKRSTDPNYVNYAVFNVNWPAGTNSGEFEILDIEYNYDGIEHDFEIQMFNAVGLEVSYDNGGVPVGGYIHSLNNLFDGVEDLNAYAAVTNLTVISDVLDEGDGSFTTPYLIHGLNIVRLTWDDARFNNELTNHPHSDGNTYTVTTKQWRNIQGYPSYMYIGISGIPSYNYPHPNEQNGVWVKLGEPNSNYLDVTIPECYSVGFWIGAKIRTKNILNWVQPYDPEDWGCTPIWSDSVPSGIVVPSGVVVIPSGLTHSDIYDERHWENMISVQLESYTATGHPTTILYTFSIAPEIDIVTASGSGTTQFTMSLKPMTNSRIMARTAGMAMIGPSILIQLPPNFRFKLFFYGNTGIFYGNLINAYKDFRALKLTTQLEII